MFGGYSSYEEVVIATDKSYDVDSWVVGLSPTLNIGPLTFNIEGWLGQNMKNYGGNSPHYLWNAFYDAGSDSVVDIEGRGFMATLSYKFNDKILLQAGYGQREETRDIPGLVGDEDKNTGYFLTMPIKINDLVTIQPEIMYIDWDSDKISGDGSVTDMGNTLYYMTFGHWQTKLT